LLVAEDELPLLTVMGMEMEPPPTMLTLWVVDEPPLLVPPELL